MKIFSNCCDGWVTNFWKCYLWTIYVFGWHLSFQFTALMKFIVDHGYGRHIIKARTSSKLVSASLYLLKELDHEFLLNQIWRVYGRGCKLEFLFNRVFYFLNYVYSTTFFKYYDSFNIIFFRKLYYNSFCVTILILMKILLEEN